MCEGEVTEPEYFRHLTRELKLTLVSVEIVKAAGVPRSVVGKAAELKKERARQAKSERDGSISYDQVWCVFDVDDHPGLAAALEQARANGISVALSNPCFELWAALHFFAQQAAIERKALRRKLKKHLPRYEKSLPCEELAPARREAIDRARRLASLRKQARDPRGNPSTGVYVLVEMLESQRFEIR